MATAEAADGGDVAAAIEAMHRDLRGHLKQLTGVSAAAPIGAATRFADAMNGAARAARQRSAYSV
jgi:hypothetical protein